MKHQGVLQPIVVRPRDDGYELIAGERRWRAAQLAGLLKIPAVVRETEDNRLLELALIENLQREDLNPMEAATAFRTLIDELGMTQQEVADRVGKQRVTITNLLRLLGLPSEVQEQVRTGKVSMGHARALASLATAPSQVELALRIAREGLTVRQVEAIVSRASTTTSSFTLNTVAPSRDPNVVAAEQSLQRALKTRVRIVPKKKGGRIELHFFSTEELERVYELIMSAAQT